MRVRPPPNSVLNLVVAISLPEASVIFASLPPCVFVNGPVFVMNRKVSPSYTLMLGSFFTSVMLKPSGVMLYVLATLGGALPSKHFSLGSGVGVPSVAASNFAEALPMSVRARRPRRGVGFVAKSRSPTGVTRQQCCEVLAGAARLGIGTR